MYSATRIHIKCQFAHIKQQIQNIKLTIDASTFYSGVAIHVSLCGEIYVNAFSDSKILAIWIRPYIEHIISGVIWEKWTGWFTSIFLQFKSNSKQSIRLNWIAICKAAPLNDSIFLFCSDNS